MAATATATIFIFSLFSLCLGSNYDIVYQFGDSISDAGNYIRETPSEASSRVTRLPYGQTYFKKPTGRVSDGRLVIDFLMQELGLPLLHPYLERDSSHFHHGVNFAVAGATAVDTDILNQYNITNIPTNSSLHVQLDWFFSHLNTMYSNKTECGEKIKKALIVVGEIGINEYASLLLEGKSIDQVKPLVPCVIKSIRHAVEKLIDRGATRLIVPGVFAIGCFPMFLTLLKNNDSSYYDDTKCLKDYNKFAEYHNKHLKATLSMLSKENPEVIILYADYYNAFQSILRDSGGFEKKCILKACCGTGGDYNFGNELCGVGYNAFQSILHDSGGFEKERILKGCCGTEGDFNFGNDQLCGVGGVSSCSNPAEYISWDGSHFTEMGNKLMFKWILKNNLSFLKI